MARVNPHWREPKLLKERELVQNYIFSRSTGLAPMQTGLTEAKKYLVLIDAALSDIRQTDKESFNGEQTTGN